MEIRLVYYGPLIKAAGKANRRAWKKQQIRLLLHPQLKHLWDAHPLLSSYKRHFYSERDGLSQVNHSKTWIRTIANRFGGFVPVVNADFGVFCELDILFLGAEPTVLKRDAAGGDLDNRIKTLLDALCIPRRGGISHRADEPPNPDPIFVLLQHDSLVTSIKVTADRLLVPNESDNPVEACVVIRANVKTAHPLKTPYGVNV